MQRTTPSVSAAVRLDRSGPVPKPQRQRVDAVKALVAALDPDARAERSAANIEQRTSSAIAIAQITDLQKTVHLRDEKIDRMQKELHDNEKIIHDLERTVDNLKNDLRLQKLMASLPQSSRHILD